MPKKSSNPILLGLAVAAVVIGAFLVGWKIHQDQNTGPAERFGEALDDAAKELEGAIKQAQ